MSVHFVDFAVKFHHQGQDLWCDCESEFGEAEPQSIDVQCLDSIANIQSLHSIQSEQKLKEIGRRLFACVFHSDLYDAYLKAKSGVQNKENKGLRICIHVKHDHWLNTIPWEILHDGEEFIALNPLTPIVRYVPQNKKLPSYTIDGKPRLLFSMASPVDAPQLSLTSEKEVVQAAVEESGFQNGFLVLEHTNEAGESSITRNINRAAAKNNPIHIWHHCGHGALKQLDPLADPEFVLWLEDGHHKKVEVPITRIASAVNPHLRLIILSVCRSGDLTGLGTHLANLNVPYVLGYRNRIEDSHALAFVEELYAGLFYQPLEWCVTQGRRELYRRETFAWFSPILYTHTSSSVLLKQEHTQPRDVQRSIEDERRRIKADIYEDTIYGTPDGDIKLTREDIEARIVKNTYDFRKRKSEDDE